MEAKTGNVRGRVKKYWCTRWAVPEPLRPFVRGLVAAYVMYGMIFLWFVLSLIPAYRRLVEAVGRLFPAWFPITNVFLAPVLAALVGGPLFRRPLAKVVLAALMLFSFSALSLLYNPRAPAEHQAAIVISEGFLYFEAFVLIPWWNRQHERRRLQRGTANVGTVSAMCVREGVRPVRRLRFRPKLHDLLLYIVIAFIFVSLLVAYTLTR